MTRAAQALLESQVKRDVTFDPRHEAFSDLVHQIAAAARRTDFWNRGYELAIATAEISTLDAILGDSAVLGRDATPYRNNALRVANLYFIQSPSSARRGFEKIAIAAAFHDLGFWTNHSFDCLAPSGLSSDWLASSDEPRWTSWLRYAADAESRRILPRLHAGFRCFVPELTLPHRPRLHGQERVRL